MQGTEGNEPTNYSSTEQYTAAGRLCALTAKQNDFAVKGSLAAWSNRFIALDSRDPPRALRRGRAIPLLTTCDGQNDCESHARKPSRTTTDLLLTRASDYFARAVLLCVMCQGFTK